MSEAGVGGPRIQVETVDSNVLAYVSTEPLWRSGGPLPGGSPREGAPSLRICWPSGRPFGCLRKAGHRAWAVQVDGRQQDVLSFVGDLRGGCVNVNTLSMQSVAATSHVSGRDYRATVRAHCDAGLVILALVAIEKCEALACSESAPTVGDLPQALATAHAAAKADVRDTTASGSSGGAAPGSNDTSNGTSDNTHGTSNSASNSTTPSVTNSACAATVGNSGSGSGEARSDGHASDASQKISD